MTNPAPTSYPLPPRTFIRAGGPDAERFLNGQLTQDVRLATEERAVFSAVVNAKGQLDAVCWVRRDGDTFLLDAPFDLREDLYARLDRYLIADDVTLTDESDDWHVTLVEGDFTVPEGVRFYDVNRTGVLAREALTTEPLVLPGVSEGSPEDLADERIRHGVPAWGAELIPGLLPPDAGLDRTAVSYEKGCYLGQEVLSRMKRAGKTNQHLVVLELNRVPGLQLPCPLLVDGQPAGTLTSVASSPLPGASRVAALGFRKRKFAASDQLEVAAPDGTLLGITARKREHA